MRGKALWPLKALAEIEPELGASYRAKYFGREHIATLHVPILDCAWDEVVFLSPIHPQLTANAMHQAGHVVRATPVYQIPADALKSHEAIWFDPKRAAADGSLTPESVSALNLDAYLSKPLSEYAMPAYQRSKANGRRPLTLGTELHVLVRGYGRDGIVRPIDVSGAQTIAAVVPELPRGRA